MRERVNSPADLKRLNPDELRQLAAEIREALISTVIQTGGHLASNLGVVELTIALHFAFDSPEDAIVWDVGHQAYVHKLLTGRGDRFATIRQRGGLSGFCSRDESPHDPFGAGHAGTSVSAALGLAIARDLLHQQRHVVAVIGDGAMTSGLAFEGVDNAGHLGSRLIVVLNDNDMSISPNVGAIARYMNRLRTDRRYHQAKAEVEHVLGRTSVGMRLLGLLRRLKSATRFLLLPAVIWEELGFTYVGPVDGHDLGQMIEVFERVKCLEQPVLVHVVTVKGKGYGPAEADATGHHGVSPKSNGTVGPTPKPPTYTRVFSDSLVEAARRDPRIVAITAAMPDGSGLAAFAREFPDRFFDVGIAEGHAVTYAAGLAAGGLRPVVAIYSTFLQRAFDSVLHDVCTQNLPVVFALDRAGIVGDDGKTHQGLFDIAYLRCIPNLVVMAPKDACELQRMVHTALDLSGPAAIRYPRGASAGTSCADPTAPLTVGEAEVLRQGHDLAIVAIGSMVAPSMAAAETLRRLGVDATVVNARFVKPLDAKTLVGVARQTRRVVTVEEHVSSGGFGSAVAELLADQGLSGEVRMCRIAVPDVFVEHGPQSALREEFGLSPDGIVRRVLREYPELSLAQASARGRAADG